MTDRLVVLWSDPVDGRRHIVGDLQRLPTRDFAFAYRQREVAIAQEKGFKLLPEFPDVTSTFAAPYLFATFAQRIPSPKRPDYLAIMQSWGVERADDQLEVLALSGGIQMTDRIELAEHRALDDDLQRPLSFRLAARRHYPRDISLGMVVEFQREPENLADSSATLVVVADGTQIGYVPRQYSELVARHLDAGHAFTGSIVRRLVVPQDRDRWVVQMTRVR